MSGTTIIKVSQPQVFIKPGVNVLVTYTGGPQGLPGETLNANYMAAMNAANSPTGENAFATVGDLPGFGAFAAPLTTDENYVTDTEKAELHAPGSDDQDLSYLMPKAAEFYATQVGSFTVLADMGDANTIPIGGATITLPALPAAGFYEGWQASFHNIAPTAVDATLSGTVKAAGTKCGQYKRFTLTVMNNVFYATGGLSV